MKCTSCEHEQVCKNKEDYAEYENSLPAITNPCLRVEVFCKFYRGRNEKPIPRSLDPQQTMQAGSRSSYKDSPY